MSINLLGWQNEHYASDYPLSRGVPSIVRNFISDASFVQFNAFVPILVSIVPGASGIALTILCDTEIVVVNIPPAHAVGKAVRVQGSGRYMGKVVIGPAISTMFDSYLNKKITVNVPFCSTTVVSIPLASGLYSLNGIAGNIFITTDENQFFDINGNNVVWNAVGVPAPVQGLTVLRSLNGQAPVNNNLTIQDAGVLKLVPNLGSLTVQLNNSPLNDNISPTKNYA